MSVVQTAVPSLWTLAAGEGDKLQAPSIEYGKLSPTLIVLGVAALGIVIEAFLPRKSRYPTQVFLSLLGLAAAFAAVVGLAASGSGGGKAQIVGMGALAVDGPALFLQGTILLVGIVGVFTFAERRLEPASHGARVDSFAAQPASVPGGEGEREATKAGWTTTEVFPLLMFAVGGMLLFPAANDLLTLFIALEVFSSRCTCCARWRGAGGCCRRRRRSSTSCWAPSPRRSCCSASRCCTATRAPSTTRASPGSSPAPTRRPIRCSPTPWATTRCC